MTSVASTIQRVLGMIEYARRAYHSDAEHGASFSTEGQESYRHSRSLTRASGHIGLSSKSKSQYLFIASGALSPFINIHIDAL